MGRKVSGYWKYLALALTKNLNKNTSKYKKAKKIGPKSRGTNFLV